MIKQTNAPFELDCPKEVVARMVALGRRLQHRTVLDLSGGGGCFAEHFQDSQVVIRPVHEVAKTWLEDHGPAKAHYDLCMMIPLWGTQRIEDPRRAGRFDTFDMEVVFLRYALRLLSEQGTLITLVPNNLLCSLKHAKFRSEVLAQYRLVQLIPYARTQEDAKKLAEMGELGPAIYFSAAILVLSKKNNNDQAYSLFESWDCSQRFQVPYSALESRWDYIYHNPQNSRYEGLLHGRVTMKLGDQFLFLRGFPTFQNNADNVNRSQQNKYRVVSGKCLRKGELIIDDARTLVISGDVGCCALRKGDLILGCSFKDDPENGWGLRFAFIKEDMEGVIAGSSLTIIRGTLGDYLYSLLHSPLGMKIIGEQLKRLLGVSSGFGVIPTNILRELTIPIIPIADMSRLGDEAISRSVTSDIDILLKEIEKIRKVMELNTQGQESLQNAYLLLLERSDRLESQIKKNHSELLQFMSSLKQEMSQVKSMHLDAEEKIIRLQMSIEKALHEKGVEHRFDLDQYRESIQSWMLSWNRLEDMTKKFLVQAEYLYEELGTLTDADFSPFVLQFCRALENEILIKAFCAYHEYLHTQKIDTNALIQADLSQINTKTFARHVKADNRKYTLGEMSFILHLLHENGNTLQTSALLQDFRIFLVRYFDENVLQKEFLNRLRNITENFRNRSAHPDLIAQLDASSFRRQMKELLNDWMDSLKT